MELLVPILFFVAIFYIVWAVSAYDMVEVEKGRSGLFVFVTIFLFGIFGFIACLLFPQKENKKKIL